MAKREFLQLAHTYDPVKHGVGGWYMSEKLDGMRAYWDGGHSRGQLTSQIPYANTAKDYRRVTPPIATGLWTRYGKPIHAPDWWLDKLPLNLPLDGELFIGRGKFQRLISVVKKFEPNNVEWRQVLFLVLDVPSDYHMFRSGRVNNPQWSAEFKDMRDLFDPNRTRPKTFRYIQKFFEDFEWPSTICMPLAQSKLPMQTDTAKLEMYTYLDHVIKMGGEGLILRHPDKVWEPTRNYNLLKLKPSKDSEAMVVGYIWGHGKLEGLMGALRVNWHNKTFDLSGFTEDERVLVQDGLGKASGTPGTRALDFVYNMHFPRGSKVTFKYRELTDAGVPKEARYFRKSI